MREVSSTTTGASRRGAMEREARPRDPVRQFAAMCGTDGHLHARRPGMSAFVLEDGAVFHTYSTYARGLDALWGVPVA